MGYSKNLGRVSSVDIVKVKFNNSDRQHSSKHKNLQKSTCNTKGAKK